MPGQRCLTHGLWDALGEQIAAFLESVTLQEVIDGIPAASRPGRHRRQPERIGLRNERRAHISRLERHGAAAARGARGDACGARRRRQSVLAACRGPARARPRSRMRASRWRRWSAPSRPRSFSPAAARKPTTPCWPPAGMRSSSPASSTTRCWRRPGERRAYRRARGGRDGEVRGGQMEDIAASG